MAEKKYKKKNTKKNLKKNLEFRIAKYIKYIILFLVIILLVMWFWFSLPLEVKKLEVIFEVGENLGAKPLRRG